MATQKEIKQKIVSTKSINKITQAMQLVSTSKSQKAVKELRKYKGYYLKMKSIMSTVSSVLDDKKENYNGTYWMVFTSDLGLAGGYNIEILKVINRLKLSNDKIFVIGNKGKSLVKDKRFWMSVEEMFKDQNKLYKIIIDIISDCKENNLMLKTLYTEYVSQLEYKPKIVSLIPADFDKETIIQKHMEFEPKPMELIEELQSIYTQVLLTGIYKETQASENTSRRVAMENATKNSDDMLKDLNIQYNRTRQEKITQELTEIIGGAEALK